MKNKRTKLSRSFQRWLLAVVAIAFLATTAFLWLIQTRLSQNNAISLLELNLSDVQQDIIDASDEHLLKLARSIADDLNAMEHIDSACLPALITQYDVTEINVIDGDGFIFATTYPDFLGYDMRSGAQSAEFLVLLSGEDAYVQSYQPVSYDASISRKYGGVALENGGFVQVGYGAERFQRDIDEFVVGVTRNRHVGAGGCIIIVDEDTLAFLVADVSGKGIPAAMFMMQSKTLLKSCAESGMSVEQVFTMANEKLCEGNEAGMFVTAWMGLLNVKTGLLTFANAGHNPPLIRRADGSFAYLKVKAGFVLAGMEGIRYRRNELQLSPGDVLYLYTDGVTEATDAKENLYGEERLQSVLNKRLGVCARGVCEAVKADVDAFVAEAEQFDDITMLCLTYHGEVAR